MQGMNAKTITRWPWAIVALLALSQTLSAGPYDPPKIESSGGAIISWIYVVVGLAGVCVVAFKNSRRTHLD